MRRVLLVLLLVASAARAADTPVRHNYRLTEEYAALSKTDRDRVDQVHADFVLLWGALDMYAEDHDGQVPKNLTDLVPTYLGQLPRDPFATEESALEKFAGYPTLKGFGYRYSAGTGRAFVLHSVGLQKFPYRKESGGGLILHRGWWRDGRQFGDAF